MSNNPSNPFSTQPDDEQQSLPVRPGFDPETNPTDEDGLVDDSTPINAGDGLHEIRQQLRSDKPEPTEKKRGFFARLFGGEKKPKDTRPEIAPPSEPKPPKATGQLGFADDENIIKTGENEFDIYHGYEQYQISDYEELVKSDSPANDQEPTDGLAGLEALANSNTPASTKPQGDLPQPISGSEDKTRTPEWREFLTRFLTTKDEEAEAKKYVVTDDVVENRLIGAMTDAEDDAEWSRMSRSDNLAKRPAVLPTLPGEEQEIDETWLAELRGEEAQPSQPAPSREPPASEEEDWLAEPNESHDQILKNRLQGTSTTQPEASPQEPEEDDPLNGRLSFFETEETTRPFQKPVNPAQPATSEESDPFSLNEPGLSQGKPRPTDNLPDAVARAFRPEVFFGENERQSIEPSQDEWRELRKATTSNDEPVDRSSELSLPDAYSELHPELFDSSRLGAAPALSRSEDGLEPASQPKAPPRSAVLRETQNTSADNSSSEIRSTALEGYDAPQGPVEVFQPSTGKTSVERAANWFSTQNIAIQVILGMLFLGMIAALVGIPMFFIQRAALMRSQVVIQPTPVSFSGVPYPTGLRITGGWYFNLAPATLKDGKWEPQGSEWLEGTEIRRVVGVPWSRQSEAVANSLRAGDKIEMQMSNGDLVNYVVSTVQQVPVEDTSIFDGRNPSLAVILFQQSTANRWVIIADLKQ